MQIVGFGFIATVLIVILRQQRKELAILLSMGAGIMIFLKVIEPLHSILTVLEELTVQANLDLAYMDTLLKIVGIAYITEFGAQVCNDAGEGTIAKKIELAGKIAIMLLAVPLVLMILETVLTLLPS
ncbi:stage III sporulation protein AD [Natranaerobius thermophilus JW/NM-WN-LF]|uniref:Stage III sporulation protein AD n=1 Tax=Natranaerobius thermophilus (strain ATCC BAA-1301 / DSM 18059 / JW/NM-WN-LF) TaxID=457570 RepID=B2A542_NATTJ|nr:stage III sporulation protein AD [Natranaerobius thermophilus JW/NM-WN-LF]